MHAVPPRSTSAFEPWCSIVVLLLTGGAACGDDTAPTAEAPAAPEVAPRRLDVSGDRTCVVSSDGSARCWGDEPLGQPGPMPVVGSSAPLLQVASGERGQRCLLLRVGSVRCEGDHLAAAAEAVGALRRLTQISIEDRHACAVDEDGGVACWGDSFSLGRRDDGPEPARVEGMPPARAVDVSTTHACAIGRDGSAWCWGRGFALGLGRESSDDSGAALRVDGVEDAIALSVSFEQSCALGAAGDVVCWGRRAPGDFRGGRARSVARFPGAHGLSVNDAQICVLLDGAVRCAGHDAEFTTIDGVRDAVEVALGRAHGCARSADDTVRCWGDRSDGQLGEPVANPALPGAPAARDVARVEGGHSMVAFQRDGAVLELGVRGAFEPIAEAAGAEGIGRGSGHLCWWSEGRARCRHSHDTPMGEQRTTSADHPELGPVKHIAFWGSGGCALAPTGGVRCWATPSRGLYSMPGLPVTPSWRGDGEPPAFDARPNRQLLGVEQIVAAHSAVVARAGSGEVRVGLGPIAPVSQLRGATDLAAGPNRACAVVDGRVACWVEDHSRRGPPLFIDGIDDATQVSVYDHGCARLASGQARCWGDNEFGELGDGTLDDPPEQVAVVVGGRTPLTGVVQVAAFERGMCVLLEDRTVRCAGTRDGIPPPEPAESAVLVPRP